MPFDQDFYRAGSMETHVRDELIENEFSGGVVVLGSTICSEIVDKFVP